MHHKIALSLLVFAFIAIGCRTNMLPEYHRAIDTARVSSLTTGGPEVSIGGSSQDNPAAALISTVVSIGVSSDTYDKIQAAADPQEFGDIIQGAFETDMERFTNFKPTDGDNPDTQLNIDVVSYGLTAATIESEVFFFMQVEATMVYLPENKLIWEYGDTLSMPLKDIHIYSNSPAIQGMNTAVNFALISELTEEELRAIFTGMADNAATILLNQMREDIHDH